MVEVFVLEALANVAVFMEVFLGDVVCAKRRESSAVFFDDRNLPVGDNDLRLNLEDLSPSLVTDIGEDGRKDFRRAAGGEGAAVGDGIARMVGVGLMVGVGPDLIVERNPPFEVLGRCRWKLLTDASESLSYVGTAAFGLLTAVEPVLIWVRVLGLVTEAGICFFWSAPLGGFVSTDDIL